MFRAASKNASTDAGGTWNRSTSSRVKSWRSKVVESENIGLSKRMSFNWTIESAISPLQ